MWHKISPNFFLWLVFSVIYFLLSVYTYTFIITDEIFYNTLLQHLTIERVEKLLAMQKENQWISYLIAPMFLFIKVFFVGVCIITCLFIFDIPLQFNRILRIAYTAEIIFVLAAIIRIILLQFFYRVDFLDQLQQFAPLSLYSVFASSTVLPWLAYPLQTLNLFEAIYMLLMGYLLSKEINQSFGKGLMYVCLGYGSGLLLWFIIVVFLLLQIM